MVRHAPAKGGHAGSSPAPVSNVANRTVWTGDNLDVLRGINSGSVDLIYLDPPFNSNRTYSAPIGSEAAGAAFKDTWTLTDVDRADHGLLREGHPALAAVIAAAELAHGKGMASYLIMMAVRLVELRRVLRDTGSIYLHCDPTASHYLKLVMDSVFGAKNFRNEVVWGYTGPGNYRRDFPRKHDTVFRYVMGKAWTFNADDVRVPYVKRDTGQTSGIFKERAILPEAGKVVEDWWVDATPVGRLQKERTGYPTQKPLALLERIIKASSNPGDMVLDPFCGCATTLVAAEALDRQWAGIDLSPLAVKLVEKRLRDTHGVFGQITARTDVPQRTDLGTLPPYRSHLDLLYGRQSGDCNGCLVHFPKRNLTIDHKVARAKGGTDHVDNLQLLCGACNSKKGTRSQAALVAALQAEGLR